MKKLIPSILGVLALAVGTASADPTEVTVTGNDQMQFDKKSIEVKAGAKVKLTLKHIGNLPKVAMGHNIVILKKGTDVAKFATAAATAATTEFIPEAFKDKILAHTKMIGSKESTTIEFTAPKEAGEYDYICTFPGHFALMKGKLVVK